VIPLRLLICAMLAVLAVGCSGDAQRSTPPASTGGSGESTAASPASARVVLTGDGVEVDGRPLLFGASYDEAVGPLTATLGAPTLDTGATSPFSVYGTCPGSVLRALEYAGGAVVLLFGDVGGPGQRLYAWNLREQGRPEEAPLVRALVGDVSTVEFGIGTTVAELRAGVAEGTLEVHEGEEVFGPGFRITDQSRGLFGSLTDPGDTGTVTFVSAGQTCGE
jgi:hypothetical protein